MRVKCCFVFLLLIFSRCLMHGQEVIPAEGLISRVDFDRVLEGVSNFPSARIIGGNQTKDRFGRDAQAYDFSAGGELRIQPAILRARTDWTFSCWFRVEEQFWERVVLLLEANPANLASPIFSLGLISAGRPWFSSWNANKSPEVGGNENWVHVGTPRGTIRFGSWFHLAATFSARDERVGTLKVYVNGRERQDAEFQINDNGDTQMESRIGKGAGVDDLRVYDRALELEEIRSLTAEPPFSILDDPSGGSVEIGTSLFLNLNVYSGFSDAGEGLSYQWFRDGVLLGGANSSTLVVPEVSLGDEGRYYVEVSGFDVTLASKAADIQVLSPPVVETLYDSIEIEVGESLNLSINALGTPPLMFQWRRDGKDFFGATDASLTLPNAVESLAGSYSVVVSNEYGTLESEVIQVSIVRKDDDGDGLTNFQESELGTDPNRADTDGDGLLDPDEISEHGTSPTNSDTDGDGLDDWHEINVSNTKPTEKDSDGDGLIDPAEIELSTNPNNPDSDGDGLTDSAEVNEYRSNPNALDTDGDGLYDGIEVAEGFDPTVAAEAPEGDLEVFRSIEIQVFTLVGRRYRLEASQNLTDWEDQDKVIDGVGGFSSIFLRLAEGQTFWRLQKMDDL